MMGAGLRRVIVYLIACALVLVVGVVAARLTLPADPYPEIHVEGDASGTGAVAETEAVRWDNERGRGTIDVRERDGVVRRYYMEETGEHGMRMWGGQKAPPEGERAQSPDEW
jgi:hypothetical protein